MDNYNKQPKEQIDVEKIQYVDYSLKSDVTLRIFTQHKLLNKYQVTFGRGIEKDNEILIDENFSIAQKLNCGDKIEINNKEFTIVGFAISPDYICTKKNQDILQANADNFGISFVSENVFNDFCDSKSIYSYKLNGFDRDEALDIIRDKYELVKHLEKEGNSRMIQIINDAKSPIDLSVFILIFLFVIIGGVISIDVINTIKNEKKNIYLLYASGYSVKEVFVSYIFRPLILLSIGIIGGIGIGLKAVRAVIYMHKGVYNYPIMQWTNLYPLFIMLSIIVPIAIVFIIISYSLIKKLNKAPIEILNSDKDEKKKGKGQVRYGKNFINDYRIREIKENKGNLCIFVVSSLLISVLLVFSFTLKYTVDEYMKALNVETKYNNLYVFDKLQSSKDKESTFEEFVMLKLNIKGSTNKVVVQSTDDNSKYFAYEDENGENNVGDIRISRALSKKYKYDTGDEITVYNDLTGKEYTFKIDNVIDNNNESVIYINKERFSKIFDWNVELYNAIAADTDLSEEFLSDKSNICTTKAEVISSGKAIVKVINSIVSILICFSIFISIIVLYLICKYNIDRNSINISLLKVLGYSDSEINTMYEKWNELVISCVFILSIPIGVLLVGIFFVGIVGNLNNYIDTKVSITYCVLCFVLIISGYIVSSKLIKNSISKIEMSKILKDGKE